jgi:hypothetical protein
VEYLEGRTLLSPFVVSNLNDSGDGSLRQAIIDSNKTAGPNEIDFAAGLSGTITLTSGELLIENQNVSIDGHGQDVLSVSGNDNSRVLEVAGGVSVSLSGMTITGGQSDQGGGILNQGNLTITSSMIRSNYASRVWSPYGELDPSGGGGVFNTGRMTLDNVSVAENTTGGSNGAGIFNSGEMAVSDSTIIENIAGTYVDSIPGFMWVFSGGGDGGGIYNSGFISLTSSAVTDNTGTMGASWPHNYWSGYGGGIYNNGAVVFTNSAITGNDAGEAGGGAYNDAGELSVTNSTIAGNQVYGAWGGGGGIYNGSGTVILAGSTLAGNQTRSWLWPAHAGGGVFNGSGLVSLSSSIVASNSAPAGPGQDVSGTTDSLGRNLISHTAGSSGWVVTGLGDVDPVLGPLQNNGGPTMTMALLPGSPAIDAGSNELIPAGVMYDQRGPGFQRIVNGTVDIGAFEWQPYVSSFVASWGTQTAPLKLAADGLHVLPMGRKTDLPWSNINTLTITLSTAEALTSANLMVSSATGVDYGAVLNGSGTAYTISLAHPVTNADRLTIKLNLAGLVTPTFEMDVLPGDVNDDGVVNASDIVLIRNAFQKTGDPLMIGWCDVDGDGVITVTDLALARKKLGSGLP